MISTKGRYGLRVMLDLAEHQTDGCVTLKDIAQRQNISKKYLEIIVKKLVDGKFLLGISGKGGGYRLTRPPEEYTVGEILEYMEDTLATVACLKQDAPACPRAETCHTLPLWSEFDRMVHDFFFSRSLDSLLKPDNAQQEEPHET